MPHGMSSWRRSFPSVVLISLVASLLAACGASSSGVTTATVTSLPTATPIPVPCTAWRIIPSPNPSQSQPIDLYGVSADAPTDVWAVGHAKNSSTIPTQYALIEQSDGTTWHLVSSPPTDDLHGVAAISPSDVWAVGGIVNYGNRLPGDPPHYRPLIEHWNGSQWSVVPGESIGLALYLNRVTALAPNDVWAVGSFDVSGDVFRPLIEHWNGTAWQAINSPIPAGEALGSYDQFIAVTPIPGTHQLWAVGSIERRTGTSTSSEQGLIEQWDGTAWHLIATPTLSAGAVGSVLSGVVALSPTDAWAVGDYIGSDGKARPLILRWDGATWQVIPSPDAQGSLAGVAAAGAYDVRAVGTDDTTGQALIEQWNGAAWHLIASPIPSGATKSALHSATADRAGDFWAVGSSQNAAGTSQTLIERCP